MTRTKKTLESRRDSSLAAATPRGRAPGFKPVALPAVAAAVQAARPTATRRPPPRDIPAILRELGILD